MKAALIHSFSGIEKIEIESIPERAPDTHEISIEIYAAGINPIDWKVAEGMKKDRMPYQLPITLGWECSGVVKAVGEGVSEFKKGDRVCALYRGPTLHEGTYAEVLTLPASMVAQIPSTITFEQGASFPLAATTAWQALQKLKTPLQKILILGGAGGVGSFAIQLAKILGAEVTTTAQQHNHAYLMQLGADHCIDYREMTAMAEIGTFKAILDCVGKEGLEQAYPHLEKGGHIVSIATFTDPAKLEKAKGSGEFFVVKPEKSFLERFIKWIQEGSIQFPEIDTYPFDHVIEALRENRARHVRGKRVLLIK
jgi:NADPH:quinone reductase-like Zn-dependent oxidoreductase